MNETITPRPETSTDRPFWAAVFADPAAFKAHVDFFVRRAEMEVLPGILAAPCGSKPATHEAIGLIVHHRANVVDGVAETVTLTADGRRYDQSDWHQGPENEWIYVERWDSTGRTFHGWIDSVSRQLLQAG